MKNAPGPANAELKQAMQHETELLFQSILREDRSALDLLNADYTFVNERLARLYGIPNIYGNHFRRVQVTDPARRGLLGQGSLLLVTSVADRTSPVARGKWILENLLGVDAPAAAAERSRARRKAPARCSRARFASGWKSIARTRRAPRATRSWIPSGSSLENFDLTGQVARLRIRESPIDASGQLVDGTKLNGPASLRQALLDRSDAFVTTMTEKLMTYGLGRGVRYYDMPAVRAIVRDAARTIDRFSSLVLGIVKSAPFQMRVKSEAGIRPQAKELNDVHHARSICRAARCCAAWESPSRLPLLESMVPAQTALANTAANPRPAWPASTFRTAPPWTSGRRRRKARASSSRKF